MALSCYFGAEINLSNNVSHPENLVTPVIPNKSLLSVTQVSITSESFLLNRKLVQEYTNSATARAAAASAAATNNSSKNAKGGNWKGSKNSAQAKKLEAESEAAVAEATQPLDDRVILFAQGTQAKKPIALCTLQPSKGIFMAKIGLIFSKYASFHLVPASLAAVAANNNGIIPNKLLSQFNAGSGLAVHITGYYECDDGDDGDNSSDNSDDDSEDEDDVDFGGAGDSELAPHPAQEKQEYRGGGGQSQHRGGKNKSKNDGSSYSGDGSAPRHGHGTGAPRGSGAYHANRPNENNGRQKRSRD